MANTTLSERQALGHLRFGDYETTLLPDKIMLKRRIMRLQPPIWEDDDLVNEIGVCNKFKMLIIGTEKGWLYVFDVQNNCMIRRIPTSPWVNLVRVCGSSILVTGMKRTIEGFSVRGLRKTFEFKTDAKLKNSFGSRGLTFHKIDNCGNYLANTGATSFMVFNVRTRKIAKRFVVTESDFLSTNQTSSAKAGYARTVNSWTVSFKDFVIAMMLKDDPHVYFYDFKRMKMIGHNQVYDPSKIGPRFFLANLRAMRCKSVFVLLLQFSKNSMEEHVMNTFVYVYKIQSINHFIMIEQVMSHCLSNL